MRILFALTAVVLLACGSPRRRRARSSTRAPIQRRRAAARRSRRPREKEIVPVYAMSRRMECSSKHGDCVDDVQCNNQNTDQQPAGNDGVPPPPRSSRRRRRPACDSSERERQARLKQHRAIDEAIVSSIISTGLHDDAAADRCRHRLVRRHRHAPAEEPADAMREADRLLQAVIDRDAEADLALDPLRVVRHDAARLVVARASTSVFHAAPPPPST